MVYLKKLKSTLSIKYVLIIVIIALLGYTYAYTKNKYAAQSNRIGQKTVLSFLNKVEMTIHSYELIVDKESAALSNIINSQINQQDISSWIKNFDENITKELKLNSIYSYIIFNGKIYTDNTALNNIIEMQIKSDWYKSFINDKNRTVIFSPLFPAPDDEYYFTMYKKKEINNSMVIIASNLSIKELKNIWFDKKVKDREQIFYLADGLSGLSFTTYNIQTTNMILNKINNLITNIKKENKSEGSLLRDYTDGNTYSIFYINKMENNFIPVLVIPQEHMEYAIFKHIKLYIYVILFFVLVMVILFINDVRNSIKTRRTNEFINIIGNSYYAIFSINIRTDKYEIVKGNEEVMKYVPPSGVYSHLHQMLCTVVEKGTQGDFSQSFSLKNIRNLAEKGIVDFGGDFQRILETGYKWVQIRLLYNSNVSSDYAVLAFRERDDEKTKELERMELLETSMAAMKKANNSKNIFYSGLSHDMRTPLNAIVGLAELLEQDIDDKERIKDYIEKIKLSGNQLLSLIDNFLDYTKKSYITEDIKDNAQVDFQLKEYLESNLSIYKIVAAKEKKVFSTSYEITHNNLNGDTTKLYRIINNLISNSFKYTKAGDKISLKVTEIKNQGIPKFKFEFSDTGIGMDKEFIDKVCSPYKREKRFETKETAGVGLGMAIVENYVRYLNGEIFIESKINEGTKITITLAFDVSGVEKIDEEEIEENNSDITGLNILIAEDNNINMFIVTELLTRNGHHVVKAFNGKEALDIFMKSEENTFDVILMDIQMPVLNGLEAAQEIRSLNRNDAKTVPIIAVSANVYTEDVAASNKAGMNAHLSKPINYNMLQETFNSLIKKRNQ